MGKGISRLFVANYRGNRELDQFSTVMYTTDLPLLTCTNNCSAMIGVILDGHFTGPNAIGRFAFWMSGKDGL